jgi:hypothetical protein
MKEPRWVSRIVLDAVHIDQLSAQKLGTRKAWTWLIWAAA